MFQAPLNETILLVEDEADLREVAADLLRELGYTVMEAATPAEALDCCERHQGRIDLLLTDMVLPRMNGRELAARVRSLRPDIAVLFSSGYAADLVDRGALEPPVEFLEKPFSLDALATKVRELLRRSNILDFEKDFPEAAVVKLEENYRSSANIVGAATKLIANNTQRKEKTLFTSNAAGSLIQIREERNEYDEARFVAKTIQGMISTGNHELNDYAIFYRTNAQSRVLEEQLRTIALPYRLIGGIRFYERAEVKDVLSYLRLSQNFSDDIALKRIVNVPARGIGKTTVETLEAKASELKISLFDAILLTVNERVFNAGTTSKLRRFYDLIADLHSQQVSFKLSEFYSIVLEKTEYVEVLKKEDSPEAEARIANLEELDNAIAQFEEERGDEATLSNYLEELTLASDLDKADTTTSAITMMTMHISKGLEYPYVFIIGCEENLFPSSRGDEENAEDMEEERRLAYVGMTRAREKLWMTHAKIRRVWGQEQMNPPSRFLREIPKELTQFSSASGSSLQTPRFMANISRSQDFNEFAQPSYSDDEYSQVTPQVSRGSGYDKGQRVRHPTFGVGSIFSTEGAGDSLKISVLFQDNTIKKFVAKYARLEKV